jgi:hypothetical protein
MGPPLPLPAFRYGDFELRPGEAVTIDYDTDDVNLAEIVIRDSHGRWTQIIVDPHPEADRYHAPRRRRFDVENLAELPEASKEAREAVAKLGARTYCAGVIYLLLFGPWVLSGLIGAAMRRWGKPPAPEAPESTDPCVDPAFRGK